MGCPKNQCPLCGKDYATRRDDRTTINFSCQCCGDFVISALLLGQFQDTPDEKRPYLSIATRKAHDANKQVTLNTNN
jgi:hypothetical protein